MLLRVCQSKQFDQEKGILSLKFKDTRGYLWLSQLNPRPAGRDTAYETIWPKGGSSLIDKERKELPFGIRLLSGLAPQSTHRGLNQKKIVDESCAVEVTDCGAGKKEKFSVGFMPSIRS